jgi:hypothetical protein
MLKHLLAVSFGLAALTACGDDGSPHPTGQVQVGITTDKAPAGASAAGLIRADTYTDADGNILVLETASVVLRKIHLEGSTEFDCEDADDDSTGTVADSVDEEDGCGMVRLGPVLVDLPLDSTVEHQFTITVDTGTYHSVMIQIHKPTGSNDQAFLQEHPEYDGVSIRVTGTYNGTPFVFTTGVTDVQHVTIDPPLVVPEGVVSFTIELDLSGWFRNGAGGLVDPATAMGDGANVVMVHQNIIHSIHGFGDDDEDGDPDE